MGQGPSAETVHLETRVEDPPNGALPKGLALIAHGRLGGDMNGPVIRQLAEYFRDKRQLRSVTWNARGVGASGGGNEWSDLGIWMGDAAINDYNRTLHEAMRQFVEDFPGTGRHQLFICGYSAGALWAGCVRRPSIHFPQFLPARYVLVAYPVELNSVLSVFKSGSYFRAVEALVQGHGWENLGKLHGVSVEPDVAGVLTLTGEHDRGPLFGLWLFILGSKNARKVLKQVVVDGANHTWDGKVHCISEEVEKWLAESPDQDMEAYLQASGCHSMQE